MKKAKHDLYHIFVEYPFLLLYQYKVIAEHMLEYYAKVYIINFNSSCYEDQRIVFFQPFTR